MNMTLTETVRLIEGLARRAARRENDLRFQLDDAHRTLDEAQRARAELGSHLGACQATLATSQAACHQRGALIEDRRLEIERLKAALEEARKIKATVGEWSLGPGVKTEMRDGVMVAVIDPAVVSDLQGRAAEAERKLAACERGAESHARAYEQAAAKIRDLIRELANAQKPDAFKACGEPMQGSNEGLKCVRGSGHSGSHSL